MRAKINYLKGAKIWIKLILILKRRGGLKMINQGSNQEDPKIIYMPVSYTHLTLPTT